MFWLYYCHNLVYNVIIMLSEDKIIMSEQTEQSKDNVKYNKFYNVALFIDYENVCKILIKQNTNVTGQ